MTIVVVKELGSTAAALLCLHCAVARGEVVAKVVHKPVWAQLDVPGKSAYSRPLERIPAYVAGVERMGIMIVGKCLGPLWVVDWANWCIWFWLF